MRKNDQKFLLSQLNADFIKMVNIHFKHECGLIINKETHDKIKKKTVFEKFEVTPCPQCKNFGGWRLMRKVKDGYGELKVGKG